MGTWKREDNCVLENINIQRMVYANGVKLHKVHKQEKECNTDTEKQCVVACLDDDNKENFNVNKRNSLDECFESFIFL